MSDAIAASLFSWLDAAGNVNTLDVDVVMSTTDKRTAQLTDHVVETGSVVTDHIVLRPETLNFELLVTQTPMFGPDVAVTQLPISVRTNELTRARLAIKVRPSQFQPGGFLALTTGLRSVIASVLGGAETPSTAQGSTVNQQTQTLQASVLQAPQDIDRVARAFDTLVKILNTGLLVTVSFKGRIYPNYVLTTVELSQGRGESGCGRINVELRSFRTVKGIDVVLPDPADFRALPKNTKGNTPTVTPSPDPSKKAKSLFARGTDTINEANFTNNLIGLFK